MPLYEYEHVGEPCGEGQVFEVEQWINDWPLTKCPTCGGPVKKLMSRTFARSPRTDRELRDLGFTKLVRKDEGIFENVTAREGESKIVDRRRPETFPHLEKTIKD
ncbi:MAG: zinc ribbon domain-containing protein [Thermodesulfobacteriota bacterium]